MFTTSLVTLEIPPDKWQIHEPLVYERLMPPEWIPAEVADLLIRVEWLELVRDPEMNPDYVKPIGYEITVPRGFICDLASIPRLCRPLIDVNGKHRKAAVLHDWLYKNAPLLSRSFCDAEFGHAMKCCGVGWWTRKVMLAGVRMGGWCAYKKHKRRNT